MASYWRTTKIKAEHKLIAYYTAAKTLHAVKCAMSSSIIDVRKGKQYRYHILLIVQSILRERKGMKRIPYPNSRDMERLCNAILENTENEKVFTAILRIAVDILQKTLYEYKGSFRKDSGPNRTKEFTQAILGN